MDYILHIGVMLGIYLILSSSANLIVGMGNMVSLCQAAFYGIGAYICALCIINLHFSLFLILPIIFVVTGIIAIFLSAISLRLKGDYFILLTIGFQFIVFSLLYNYTDLTNGPYGLSGIYLTIFNSFRVESPLGFLIFSNIMALLTLVLHAGLIYSPFGRGLRAMRDDETALAGLGRNPKFFKIFAIVISAMSSGLAGLIYASYVSYIDPTSFTLDESIFILSAILIGGTGNMKGPIIGAFLVVLVPELLRFVGLPDSIGAPSRQIIYGFFLILIMRYRPQGIMGNFKFE